MANHAAAGGGSYDNEARYRAFAEITRENAVGDFERALLGETAADIESAPAPRVRTENSRARYGAPLFISDRADSIMRAAGRESFPQSVAISPQPHGGHRERLRECVRADLELNAFSDVEVIEHLLAYSVPQRDTNELAHELLDRFGSPLGILSASRTQLMRVPYMTKNAVDLMPLLAYVGTWESGQDIIIRSRGEAMAFFGAECFMGSESTHAVYLDGNFRVTAAEIYRGKSVAELRTVAGSICRNGAKHVILARNESDISVRFGMIDDVRTLAVLAECLHATLIDCIVFIPHGYYTIGDTADETPGYREYIFKPLRSAADASELIRTQDTGGEYAQNVRPHEN